METTAYSVVLFVLCGTIVILSVGLLVLSNKLYKYMKELNDGLVLREQALTHYVIPLKASEMLNEYNKKQSESTV